MNLPIELWINIMSYVGVSSHNKLKHVLGNEIYDDWEVKKNLFLYQAFDNHELAVLLAIRASEIEIAKKIFMEKEIDPEIAIRIAIQLDMVDKVRELVNTGITAEEDHILIAINRNNLNLVKILVTDTYINNAFDYALETMKFKVAEYLFQRGALLNPALLYKYIIQQNYSAIEFLLFHGIKVDDSILLRINDDPQILKLMIKYGTKLDFEDNEPLMHYTRTENIECVKILLENFVDINARDDLALILAIKTNNIKMVKLLINFGANVNAMDRTPLNEALINQCVSIVDLLIIHGARLDPRVIQFYLNIEITNDRYYKKYSKSIWKGLLKLSIESDCINKYNIAFLAWKELIRQQKVDITLALILLKDCCIYTVSTVFVMALLNYGVIPDNDCLQSCIRTSKLELFDLLIMSTQIHKNKLACYVLMKSAIFWDKIEFVEFLLKICDYSDDTIFIYIQDAIEGRCLEIIKTLLKDRQFTNEQMILLMTESLKDNSIDITKVLSRNA